MPLKRNFSVSSYMLYIQLMSFSMHETIMSLYFYWSYIDTVNRIYTRNHIHQSIPVVVGYLESLVVFNKLHAKI